MAICQHCGVGIADQFAVCVDCAWDIVAEDERLERLHRIRDNLRRVLEIARLERPSWSNKRLYLYKPYAFDYIIANDGYIDKERKL